MKGNIGIIWTNIRLFQYIYRLIIIARQNPLEKVKSH